LRRKDKRDNISAINTVLSKIAYFVISSVLALFPASRNNGESRIEKKSLDVTIPREEPLIVEGDSMLVGSQSLIISAEPERENEFLDTQFAGENAGENVFFAVCGMKIEANHSGFVTGIGWPGKWNDGKGGYVTIQNANTFLMTTYSHLSDVCVEEGDFVENGEVLGIAGSSGELLPGGTCQVGVVSR